MQRTAQLFALSLAVLTVTPQARADKAPAPPCFDFKAPIKNPLVAPPTESMEKTDPYDFGRKERDASKIRYDFATVSGLVPSPIQKIYEQLLDPRTIRPNKETTKISVKEVESPHFLKQIEQSITVKPVFFITLEWKEVWAYSLLKGTKAQPESILISYEKTSGTSHLRHLCGNILIQKLGPDKSSVYLFEEADADRRDAKDILNGVRGTLATLRGGEPGKNTDKK